MNFIEQNTEQILIVDFGGQTSHLICRRLRDTGIYAQIISPSTPVFTWLANQNGNWQAVKGLIFSGSPFSVYEPNAPEPCDQILALAAIVPTLGICYGLHWLSRKLGGQVEALEQKEYGPNSVEIVADKCELEFLKNIPQRFVSWMSHADSLKSLPAKFQLLGKSQQGLSAIARSVGLKVQDSMLHQRISLGLQSATSLTLETIEQVLSGELELYGLQFHPEVSHCEAGSQFLTNFARSICRCKGNWALENWEQHIAEKLRQQVQTAAVVLLISGGVDSAVVAALLLRYLKSEQIHLLYFDTGLMRLGESKEVAMQLKELGAKHFYQINVQKEFLSALAGVAEPEQKRRIIGDLFIEIQQCEIQHNSSIPDKYFLAQGTLYTDMIESGMGRHAAVIKSHHNVSSPLVRRLREQQRLLEPLASLYKDEVRRLGQKLGLSRSLTQRQPFPGPGLAIRILGALNAEKLELLRGIDYLYLETLRELGVYENIWQAFAVLLPIQSVGVTGDSRRYGPVVALRAITSADGMSCEVYPFSHEQLQSISTRISNRFPEISRVVYDISAKPPATIEWE